MQQPSGWEFALYCVRWITVGGERAMKRITRPLAITKTILGLFLCIAGSSTLAGEPPGPMPTQPTLFYACMSTAGRTEYDGAAFARENPGPVYKDHSNLYQQMAAAFDAYLTQKYGFHGLVNCGHHKTLAEAQKWLQGRASVVAGVANGKYVATDWTYDAALAVSAPSAATTTQGATTSAGQPAAPATKVSTAFYVCVGVSQQVSYESAVFEAINDAFTARSMYFAYLTYLNEKYQVNAPPRCTPKPTHAAAQAHLQEYGGHGATRRIATGWVYNATPTQSAQPAPTAPATAPAKKTMYVVCKADAERTRARYYNPPVAGGDGSYETWQPSYKSFMQKNYHYERHVACNQLPTLAEAQAYFNTMLEQARLNGNASQVIVTNWMFK